METDMHLDIVTISGFDPCGGTGLIADIETAHALGCRARAVITYQTLQNKENAIACVTSDATWFRSQLHSATDRDLFSAVKVDAMLVYTPMQKNRAFL